VLISQEDLQEGDIIPIVEEDEKWSTYKLADGTVIAVKMIPTTVIRTKKRGPDGSPIYSVNGSIVVRVVKVPDELREKTVKKKEPSEVT
jgi:hypothetical protein